jgi:hypothetical protein
MRVLLVLAVWPVAAHAVEFGQPDIRGIPVTMDAIPIHMTGTGFYVSASGHFVTAYHVAGYCARRAILRPDGAYDAKVVAMDPSADVAVLQSAPAQAYAPLTYGRKFLVGTPFQIVRYWHMGGLPSRLDTTAFFLGRLKIRARPAVGMAVRAMEPVVGGNSGSPLSIGGGAVAGMVDAVSYVSPTIVLLVDARDIARVLMNAGVPFHQDAEDSQSGPVSPLLYSFPIACYQRV